MKNIFKNLGNSISSLFTEHKVVAVVTAATIVATAVAIPIVVHLARSNNYKDDEPDESNINVVDTNGEPDEHETSDMATDDTNFDTDSETTTDVENNVTESDMTSDSGESDAPAEDSDTPAVHEHLYSPQKTEATCSNEGYTTHACECGDSYESDIVDALGHDWKAATCTDPQTCSRCGETSGEPLYHVGGVATCTKDDACSRCGKVLAKATGHDWGDSGCSGKKCSRCGASNGGSSTHNWVNGTCSHCGDDIWNYISCNEKSVTNPVSGKSMTIVELLELTGDINQIGSLSGNKTIYVESIFVSNDYISIILNNYTSWRLSVCDFCDELPCPDGGGTNCSEYNEKEDYSIYCSRCGRPLGDGYNGTCKSNWVEGTCTHYD